MTEPRRIAVVRSYDDLHAALAARAAELKVTRESLDAVSGLQSGYVAKLLAPCSSKSLGRVSLGPMLGALGLMLVVVEDAEALRKVEQRLGKSRQLATTKLPPVIIRISHRQLKKRQRAGGFARSANLPPWKRRQIARKAGRASAAKRAQLNATKLNEQNPL